MPFKIRCPDCTTTFDVPEPLPSTFHCPGCGQHLGIGQQDRDQIAANQFADAPEEVPTDSNFVRDDSSDYEQNPYQTPRFAGETSSRLPRLDDSVPERTGLPWENPGRPILSFFRTLWLVGFVPWRGFKFMRLTGGITRALSFNLLIVACVVTFAWLFTLSRGITNGYFYWEDVGFSAIFALISAAVWAWIAPFVLAALLHISLRMLGVGTYRYANTAKVALYLNGWTWTLYSLGSILPLWLPYPLATISWVMQLVGMFVLFGGYYTFALSSALETTLLKGFSACVISAAISFGAMVALVAGFFTVCLMAF